MTEYQRFLKWVNKPLMEYSSKEDNDKIEIKDYGGKVSNALSDMLKIKLKDIHKILNKMSLGNYLNLVLAIDNEDIKTIKDIIKDSEMIEEEGVRKHREPKRRSFDASTVTRRTGSGPHRKKDAKNAMSDDSIKMNKERGHRGKNLKNYLDVDESSGELKENKMKLYIGETVSYNNDAAVVRFVDEEKGKIGIRPRGESRILIVNEDSVKRLDEDGVTGTTTIPILANGDETQDTDYPVVDITLGSFERTCRNQGKHC